MQPKSNSKNTLLVIIAIILIGGAVYFFYSSGTPTDDSSLLTSEQGGTGDANIASGRALSLLTQVQHIKIESDFFTSDVFESLVDHTVPIYEQGIGKSNPFFNPNPPARTSGSSR